MGGIAIHALGSSLAHHLGQEAQEPTEAPASVHGAPVSVKVRKNAHEMPASVHGASYLCQGTRIWYHLLIPNLHAKANAWTLQMNTGEGTLSDSRKA